MQKVYGTSQVHESAAVSVRKRLRLSLLKTRNPVV
jgi:hypothetical protein